MAKKFEIRNSTAKFLIFMLEGKEDGVQVMYKNETVWASQKAMAQLFDCSTDNIGLHLKKIFSSGELVKEAVTEKNSATASDGKKYQTMFYNLDAPTTRIFFKKVQNKMHYAVHGHTAAELIVDRANAEHEHMGLNTWEKAPQGKIVKTDVSIAKNYLKEAELEAMGRIVNAFLDVAEDMAKRHVPMTMEDWAKRIDKFLDITDRPILSDSGHVSAEQAKEHAETEFEKYRVIQDRLFQSDFDRLNNNDLPSLDFND